MVRSQDLIRSDLVVLDVETTGLSPFAGDRVCEVGIVQARGSQVQSTYQTLVNPERPISPGAARVNGLSDEQVSQAPCFAEIAHQVLDLLDGALLLCHNAPFDLGFMKSEFSRLGLAFQPAGVIDTLVLARRYFRFSSNSLASLAYRFGVETPASHRALGDALTTLYVFNAISNSVNEQDSGQDISRGEPVISAQDRGLRLDLPASLQDALEASSPLEIIYLDRSGVETTRTITPRHVRFENGLVYLVAYCHLRQAERSFRLDRIVAIEKGE